MLLPRGFNSRRSNILHIRLLFVLHNLAIVWAPVLQCMILSERPSTRLPRLAFEGGKSLRLRERTMRPKRPSRQFVYALALAAILLSQQIVSQTQSPSPPSTTSTAATASRPTANKPNCTNNGTYVNSKGQTVQRPENCSGPPKGATAQCRDGSYSFSQSRRGTCSHHGGVSKWL